MPSTTTVNVGILLPLILLVLFVGEIFLQIVLSKRKNSWVGLILPALSFLIAMVSPLILFLVGYGFLWMMIGGFILANVPTVILLVIYFICRVSKPKQPQPVQLDLHNELNKMNIQDLD